MTQGKTITTYFQTPFGNTFCRENRGYTSLREQILIHDFLYIVLNIPKTSVKPFCLLNYLTQIIL